MLGAYVGGVVVRDALRRTRGQRFIYLLFPDVLYAGMTDSCGSGIQLVILDVCQKVISLDLTPQDAFTKLQELHLSCPLLPSLLLDVLVTVEGDAHASDNKEAAVSKFTQFVNLISDQIISADILRIEWMCWRLPSS
ncbi:hypothetical protein KIN20_023726 [Parelaphostrongylus tenuis]|uniref:Uncharacterized protein n=1 Tax=Parelaphostrongylus tenuis TaxID=148309 RepID=A0AAD5QVZ9_PARTN|nr:hypothetical protein KIN20_023726 [Parelaphostrongylus tenuis]